MPVRRFERNLRPYLSEISNDRFDLVCMIREPIDWLGSWYRYRQRPALVGHRNSTTAMSFDEFVTAYLSDDKPPQVRVGRPFRFVTRADNEVGVSPLFKYEHFDRFVGFLSERFEVPLAPERANVSPTGAVSLSSKVRNLAEAALADDYRVYRDIAI